MGGSIRARLLVGTGIGVALAFTIAGVLVHVLAARALGEQLDQRLVANARALSLLVEAEEGGLESEIPAEGLPGDYYELWDAAGTSLVRSASLGAHHMPAPRGDGGPLAIADIRLPDGRAARRVMIAFAPRSESPESGAATTAHLAYARSTDELDRALAALDRVLVLVGVAATLLALAMVVVVSRFALRPVHAVAASIAALNADRLDERIDAAHSPAELRVVTQRLNELLQRLAVAFERERRLTAEVAHELRTPVAGLRATIELALSRERTPERYQTALAECLSICMASERVVETLLSLARLDANQLEVRRQTVQLDELVRGQLAAIAARAVARGLTVTTELAATTIDTDPDLLRIVLTNLLDNAVTHGDAGGTLTVRVGADAAVRIANTGCTLRPDQAAQVGQRFWRGDEARSVGTHAGLGLALARELVGLLGGTLDIRVEDGWFVATATLR